MNTENCLTNKPLSEEIRNAVSAVAPKELAQGFTWGVIHKNDLPISKDF